MQQEAWTTWGQHHRAQPTQVFTPRSISQTQDYIAEAAASQSRIKVVGASRSSSAIAQPAESMLSLKNLVGATTIDPEKLEATFLAGTTVHQANKILANYGLAFENLGRLGQQTLAGAVSTGTHGTGINYGIISTQVLKMTLIDASGQLIHCSSSQHPELFRAALVGLGALGILVSITFRVVPLFRVHAAERGRDYQQLLESFTQRIRGADHYEFSWYPGESRVVTRRLTRLPLLTKGYMPSTALISQARRHGRDYALNNGIFEAAGLLSAKIPATRAPMNKLAHWAKANRRYSDLAPSVFILNRTVHQNNMEYAFALEQFADVMTDVRRCLQTCAIQAGFPLVIRTAAADNIPLSPAYGRDTVFFSAREYWRSDYQSYFNRLEEVFIKHQGRPHWGQMHSLTAADLSKLYPEFTSFTALRQTMDPAGIFLNPYLEKVLLPSTGS